MKGFTVLVDGDIVVYRCGFAAEHTVYTLIDPESEQTIGVFNSARDYKSFVKERDMDVADYEIEKEKVVEPVSHALANVKSVMARIADEAEHCITFLSQGKCFRDDIATILEYKGNRKDAPKPVHYDAIRTYLVDHYDARVVQQLEADDALAMMQTDKTIIASIDKDLLQIPGLHYNWVRDERVVVTPEVGLKKKYMQVLTGDSTDNIPGIHGMGPAGARKALANCTTEEDMFDICRMEWDVYLHSDKKKPDGIEEMRAFEVVEEVLRLIEVGGDDAYEAAKSSGEEVLLTNSP